MYDNPLDGHADRIVEALEHAIDDLETLRTTAARADADAKRLRATALLEARDHGYRSREERDAHATLLAIDAEEAAAIAERAYRDANTYIRTLQSQLELIRTRMVTNREVRV